MFLTRHYTPDGLAWALDGRWLPDGLTLSTLLSVDAETLIQLLEVLPDGKPAEGPALAPIDPDQEVWAAGVTYLRSRAAREQESQTADVYTRVYNAERPEVFFKAPGWRVVGPDAPIRVRGDSGWNVPEPEMTLVINRHGEIVGFCAGNDVSSRDIEGENPLYLPQAKVYDGSCALGPGIELAPTDVLRDLAIHLSITRGGAQVFAGDTSTSQMARTLEELVAYLTTELTFPKGAFLMTGTGIIPPDNFSLLPGDLVRVSVGAHTLENPVV
jgi:2-dehydro-3-deoxy-D-arabinonate dehydratase